MAKKRTQDAAGIAAGGMERKKRKAAEVASAKAKQLAADVFSEIDEDVSEPETLRKKAKAKKTRKGKGKQEQVAKPRILPKQHQVEDMPLLAAGFRHFEGFSDTVRNTEIAALTRLEPDMEKSRQYGFTLQAIILTEGPFAGETILRLRPTATFKFLDLPPEIRNIIYSYLIDEPKTITIESHKPVRKPRRPVVQGFKHKNSKSGLIWDRVNGKWIGQSNVPHDLLRVSKQVQTETARLLYGETAFSFRSWRDMGLFFDTIGSMRRYLRHVQVPDADRRDRGYYRAGSILTKLQDASDLQSISATHDQVCSDVRPYYHIGIDELVRLLAPLLKAVDKASQAADLPRDVLKLLSVKRNICRHCGGEDRCWWCERGHPHNKSCIGNNGCKFVCKKQADHCRELRNKLRKAMAKKMHHES